MAILDYVFKYKELVSFNKGLKQKSERSLLGWWYLYPGFLAYKEIVSDAGQKEKRS